MATGTGVAVDSSADTTPFRLRGMGIFRCSTCSGSGAVEICWLIIDSESESETESGSEGADENGYGDGDSDGEVVGFGLAVVLVGNSKIFSL